MTLLPRTMSRVICALLVWHILVACTAAQDKYAVVVGVETYDTSTFKNLEYATEDAVELGKALDGLGFQTTVMTGDSRNSRQRPSSPQKIVNNIRTVLNSCDKGDTLLISLSGHGVQFADEAQLANGVRETYFCPEDADLSDKSSLLKIGDITQLISESSASRKLLLIDSCREEVLSVEGRKKAARRIRLDSVHESGRSVPDGMAVLFSCRSNQFSWEHDPLQHSVFSFHVIQYLNGKAEPRFYDRRDVNLDGLVSYVRKRTNDYVKDNIAPDSGQAPVLRGSGENWSLGRVRIVPAVAPGLMLTAAEKRRRMAKAVDELSRLEKGKFGLRVDYLAWCYAKVGDLDGVLRATRESGDSARTVAFVDCARALRTMSLAAPRADVLRAISALRAEAAATDDFQSDEALERELTRTPADAALMMEAADDYFHSIEIIQATIALLSETQLREKYGDHTTSDAPINASITSDYALVEQLAAEEQVVMTSHHYAVAAPAVRGDVAAAERIGRALGGGKMTSASTAVMAQALLSNGDLSNARRILQSFSVDVDDIGFIALSGPPTGFNQFYDGPSNAGSTSVTLRLFFTIGRADEESVYKRLLPRYREDRAGSFWKESEATLRLTYLAGLVNDL